MFRLPIFVIDNLRNEDPEEDLDLEIKEEDSEKMYPLSLSASKAKELCGNNERFSCSRYNHPLILELEKCIVKSIFFRKTECLLMLYKGDLFLEKDLDQALEDAGYSFEKSKPPNVLYEVLYKISW